MSEKDREDRRFGGLYGFFRLAPASAGFRRLVSALLPAEPEDKLVLLGLLLTGALLGGVIVAAYTVFRGTSLRTAAAAFALILLGMWAIYGFWSAISDVPGRVHWARGRKADPRQLERDDLLERARVAERNQFYAEAVGYHRELIDRGLAPRPERVWFRVGVLRQEFLRDYDGAAAAYRCAADRLRARDAPEGEEESTASLLRDCEGRIAECVARVRELGRSDLARRDEVMKLAADGRIDEARARVDRMVEDAPDDAENNFLKAYLACKTGNYWLGLDLYRTALELDPTHHRAAYNLAATLDILGQEEEAAEAYQRYLEAAADAASEREWTEQARLQLARVRQAVERNRVEQGESS
jgi:tetratricopeptide (TPR) repeat protein